MSEETSAKVPTNSEIVDDLTKDLRECQFESDSKPPERDASPEQTPEDLENSDTESSKAQASDDSDDEDLKNQALDLSDDEKEAKRQEAIGLKTRGNAEFKSEKYSESMATYTEALHICPLKFSSDRAILYSNRAASKSMIVHKKPSAIKDCTKAITLNDQFVRAYLRRARLYEDTDKLDESFEDYKKILELDPGNHDALAANARLPPLIAERNEKMKDEMIDKLKDLGNLILRPFGLSTNNFKLQQDPNSGGYSVNFQQNSTS